MVTNEETGRSRRSVGTLLMVTLFIDLSDCNQNFTAHVVSENLRLQNFTSQLTNHHLSSSSFAQEDPIFSELESPVYSGFADFQRDKRGAVQLGQIMKCASGCNPLDYKGYGCYCGIGGSGDYVDGIDKCCKMHDWCYTTSSCMDLEYHLPYLVGFKWKCNGGAPYCIPGKTEDTGRDSCSHQLCECDKEFAMCLKNFDCPTTKAACRPKPTYSSSSASGRSRSQSRGHGGFPFFPFIFGK